MILLDARDQWEKMRKSLGDKRKQISDAQIKHITELYVDALAVAADAEHPDHGKVKIFATRDFGYHRITVERPLKLRFEITEDTLAALEASKALAKWDGRDALIESLRGPGRLGVVDEEGGAGALHAAAGRAGARLADPGAFLKALWAAVSVSDPDGEVQQDEGRQIRYRTQTYATTRTSHSTRTSTPTSPARSRPTSPTPGSTTTRRRSATRSPSPATSTSTPHPGRSPKSTPNYATSKPRSRSCSAR